jgi:hypothetical protein
MEGENLKKAMEWFDRAVKLEQEGKATMYERCVVKMLEFEKKGIEAGESWEK